MAGDVKSINNIIGRNIADVRKSRNLSQLTLAKSLARKKTQAWVSEVESGNKNLSASDLFEIVTILNTSISEIYGSVPARHGSSPKSLSSILKDLEAHLPHEAPIYLQRDIGRSDATAVDFIYGSPSSTGSIFDHSHPLAPAEVLGAMVVERYYTAPHMEPTDLVTFNGAIAPRPHSDERIADRILVKLAKPYEGLDVHPCLIRSSGDAETTLTGHDTVVFRSNEFEIIGVLTLRRTLYLPSTRRAWLQRNFGIVKDERVIDQRAEDKY